MARSAEKLDQAVSKLRTQILSGEFGARGQLPPRRVLEEELGIPKSTMSQVVLQLQGEGLLSYSGNRRLVASLPRKRVPLTDRPFVQFLRDEGLEPVTKYIELPERLPMSDDLCRAFSAPPGALYVARVRLDGTTTIPYRITSKYYRSSLIDDDMLAAMQADDRYDVILDIKKKLGISSHFLTQDIYARLPSPDEQSLLSITRNSPVLVMIRTAYDKEHGRVLWFNSIVMVASLFVWHSEQHGEQLWK